MSNKLQKLSNSSIDISLNDSMNHFHQVNKKNIYDNDKHNIHKQYIEYATIVNQNGKENIHINHIETLNL